MDTEGPSNADVDVVMRDPEPEWIRRAPWGDKLRNVTIPLPNFMIEALQNNHPLSDEHLSVVNDRERHIEKFYPSVEKSVAEIDERIARLERLRTRVEEEFANPVLKRTFACDVVKSGFRNIPMEIHMLILSHCVSFMPSPGDVLLLCKISSIWRRAVLCMPELWAGIAFTFGVNHHVSTQGLGKCLDLFAKRSGALPMRVQLAWKANDRLNSEGSCPDGQGDSTIEDFNHDSETDQSDSEIESEEEISQLDDDSQSDSKSEGSIVDEFEFYSFVQFLAGWSNNSRICYLDIIAPCLQHLQFTETPEDAYRQLEHLKLNGCTSCNSLGHDYHAVDFNLYPEAELNLAELLQAPKPKYLSLGDMITFPHDASESSTGHIRVTHLHKY